MLHGDATDRVSYVQDRYIGQTGLPQGGALRSEWRRPGPGSPVVWVTIMKIALGDLADPRVVDLLREHLASARAHTAPGSAHALDIGGLPAPNMIFWTAWDCDTLVAVGALKRLAKAGDTRSQSRAFNISGSLAMFTAIQRTIHPWMIWQLAESYRVQHKAAGHNASGPELSLR